MISFPLQNCMYFISWNTEIKIILGTTLFFILVSWLKLLLGYYNNKYYYYYLPTINALFVYVLAFI